MYRLSERFNASPARLLAILAELERSGCRSAAYLTPATLAGLRRGGRSPTGSPVVDEVVREVGEADTGVAVFQAGERVVTVVPPFPLLADETRDEAFTGPLAELLERERLIGVVLLRLGRYAVGVVRRDGLVASKTGSRYVKRRHRAGGSSQRRFERSRERLVRELFDAVCVVVGDLFRPYGRRLEHVLLGGERHTLRDFTRRCPLMADLSGRSLGRILRVDRPGQQALQWIPGQVWESRVLFFERANDDYCAV